jgi:hypothetical protein
MNCLTRGWRGVAGALTRSPVSGTSVRRWKRSYAQATAGGMNAGQRGSPRHLGSHGPETRRVTRSRCGGVHRLHCSPEVVRPRLFGRLRKSAHRIGPAEQSPEPSTSDTNDGASLAGAGGLFGEIAVRLVGALPAEEPWLILPGKTHLTPPRPRRQL